jgi:hypothetical protein
MPAKAGGSTMKHVFASCAVAAVCAIGISAQPPAAPKPGTEQKNLARFAGNWKLDGTMEPSPLAPKGGKLTGTENCTMFEGGWHLVCDSTGTGPMGSLKGHSVMTYDRGTKQYRYFAVNNMPDAEMATGTLSGNTWTWTGKMEMDGQTIHSRFTLVEKSPTVHTMQWDMSMDGKSWKTVMNGTSTKTGS